MSTRKMVSAVFIKPYTVYIVKLQCDGVWICNLRETFWCSHYWVARRLSWSIYRDHLLNRFHKDKLIYFFENTCIIFISLVIFYACVRCCTWSDGREWSWITRQWSTLGHWCHLLEKYHSVLWSLGGQTEVMYHIYMYSIITILIHYSHHTPGDRLQQHFAVTEPSSFVYRSGN